MTEAWKVDIETRLAFQEQMIAELNDALSAQQKQCEELAVLCRHLLNRLRELESGDGGDTHVDERPPHY
ncbi:MAG: SlyX family protein [Gammaproteobacteria bacterium]|nr:MAG: SlyX family protein [Gammaproteobacteria bacterium]